MSVAETYSRQLRKRKMHAENHANEGNFEDKNKRPKIDEDATNDSLASCTRHISPLRPRNNGREDMRSSEMTSATIITSTPKRRNRREKLWRPWVITEREIRHRNRIRHQELRHQELRHQHLHNQVIRHHELRHQELRNQEFLQINRSTTRQQTKSQKQPGNTPELRNQHRNYENKGSHWSAAVQVSTGFEHFKHPVKLMWPRSKAHDYFYAEGQKLLDGFPVQATIGLYDDTDSEQSDDAYVEQSQLCVAQTPKQVLVQN